MAVAYWCERSRRKAFLCEIPPSSVLHKEKASPLLIDGKSPIGGEEIRKKPFKKGKAPPLRETELQLMALLASHGGLFLRSGAPAPTRYLPIQVNTLLPSRRAPAEGHLIWRGYGRGR